MFALLAGGWGDLIVLGQEPERTSPSAVEALETALSQVVEQAEPSFCAVAVFDSTPEFPLRGDQNPFFPLLAGEPSAPIPARFGAGVVIGAIEETKEVLVLTCAHLLEPVLNASSTSVSSQIFLSFGPDRTDRATIHALDSRSDLAVLRAPSLQKHFASVQFGNQETFTSGTFVAVLGDPWGIVSESRCGSGLGTVSRVQTTFPRKSPSHPYDPLRSLGFWVRIDAKIAHGLSGGAVLNFQGELLGITTALPADIPGLKSPSLFALPCSSPMHNILEQLRAGYEVDYGFLGILPHFLLTGPPLFSAIQSNPDLGHHSPGVRIEKVSLNSPAERAGLCPHDVILQLNGKSVSEGLALQRDIALLGAGTEVTLDVDRAETQERLTLKARLGKWPAGAGMRIVSSVSRRPDWRGLSFEFPSARLEFDSDGFIPQVPHGVLIRGVQPGSLTARAGLKPGEFIVKVGEQPVETPEEFQEALQYWPRRVPVTLSDGREISIAPPETTRNQ